MWFFTLDNIWCAEKSQYPKISIIHRVDWSYIPYESKQSKRSSENDEKYKFEIEEYISVHYALWFQFDTKWWYGHNEPGIWNFDEKIGKWTNKGWEID